ncbi:CHASE4 domain-containing protein [Exiguobacterium mexicanum]|uniref:CHASE4 domain-containing protein n=1 Tax=Exiguobacterium mexicanum TaxID=340146 RepID=UPI0037C0B7B8
MRIRTKLMIAVAVNIVVFVGVIFFGVRPYFIEKSMEQDWQTVESQVASVSETLANRKHTLERTLVDWAVWNDTYTFVQKRNASYVQSNISEESLENLSVNAIVYLNRDGEAFYSAFRSSGTTLSTAEQQALIKAVTSRLSDQQDGQNGVYASDFGPTLYVSHPILRSDWSGPSQGTLVMLEFVDQAFLADMSSQTKIPLTIQPARQNQTAITDGVAGTDVVIPLGTVFQQSDFEVTFTVRTNALSKYGGDVAARNDCSRRPRVRSLLFVTMDDSPCRDSASHGNRQRVESDHARTGQPAPAQS